MTLMFLEFNSIKALVMPGLVPGIYVLTVQQQARRGWPGIGERKRRRSSNG